MSYPDVQDLLIFAGIPLAVITIVFVLVFARGRGGVKRYRPGRAYEAAPVWFLARPAEQPADSGSGRRATGELFADAGAAEAAGLTGGASDRW